MNHLQRKKVEKGIEGILLICAAISVLAIVLIIIFIFEEGLPIFNVVPLKEFLFSTRWLPSSESNPGYGILPFIVGSLYVTAGSLIIGIPIGLSCAIYLAEIAKPKSARALKQVVELLAGIPSVVYGFFGVVVICPIVRTLFGGTGYNVISASIVLAIMVLPTIINVSEVSIRAVPKDYKEGSLALGASHWQTIIKVVLPAAKSGIVAAIILGIGRSIGETMAVLMVAGNAPIMPTGPTSKVRTLTMNIVTDMGYASGDHRTALFATGIVLFVFIMLLNILVNVITKNSEK
jgi:phosphate transport system permease protein